MNSGAHRLVRAIIGFIVGGCLASVPADAAEWGASVGSGVIHSDNLERTEDGDSASLAATDVTGQIIGIGDNYDLDVEAAVIWREYFDSAYESDVLPQFRGEANWAPVPERFVWTVRNNFGQVALSPGDILQPVDRQNINVFSTGPAVTFPLGQRTNLQLAGLFSDVYYENDESDYNRLGGSVMLEREISVNQAAYIRGFTNRTEFKDEQFDSYDVTGVLLGYEGLGARTEISAEAGVEELHNEGDSEQGLRLAVDLDRNLGERSSGSLRLRSQYSDSAGLFTVDQDLQPILGDVANVQVSGDPIRLDLALITLNWDGARTSTGLFASWSNEDPDSTDLVDREIYGGGARIGRSLTDSTRIGAMASYYTEVWTGPIEQTQDDVSLSLDLQVQLSPKTSLLAYLERYSRSSSPADFDENRLMILIRYTPQAVSRELPSFYERRLNRRFVVGGERDQAQGADSEPRGNP
jgi:hypothetical protein